MDYDGIEAIFVTTQKQEDFDKLIKRVNEVGEEFYDDYGSFMPLIMTLKKKIREFEIGTKFILVAGDTALQFDVRNFLNQNYPPYQISERSHHDGWNEGDDIEFDFTPIKIDIQEMPKGILKLCILDEDADRENPIMENSLAKIEDFEFDK